MLTAAACQSRVGKDARVTPGLACIPAELVLPSFGTLTDTPTHKDDKSALRRDHPKTLNGPFTAIGIYTELLRNFLFRHITRLLSIRLS